MSQTWEANSEKVLGKLVELADADKEIIKGLVSLQRSADQQKGMMRILAGLFVVMTPIILFFIIDAEHTQNTNIADHLKNTMTYEKRLNHMEAHVVKDEAEIKDVNGKISNIHIEISGIKHTLGFIQNKMK